ncbi:hypothetical protein PoB_004911400 [Plakobranchus ocellatus]|uniref:Uncharacterized protein n=1 Tax=Plakobranchus ocellatus TaxID=259542 RepID=A0AAV4BR21_9GAST|nr:hypothetical protein PoB_004911400 [Plakobranchus ocellatus]
MQSCYRPTHWHLDGHTAYAIPDNTVLGDVSIGTQDWGRARPAVRSCHLAIKLLPHIPHLWEDSKLELGTSEQEALQQLLLHYHDAFAASKFDLSDFTAVAIDTGDTLLSRGCAVPPAIQEPGG